MRSLIVAGVAAAGLGLAFFAASEAPMASDGMRGARHAGSQSVFCFVMDFSCGGRKQNATG
jgi:hypothetical protein